MAVETGQVTGSNTQHLTYRRLYLLNLQKLSHAYTARWVL